MRYNAKKKVKVYSICEELGEYGEPIISKELIYEGTELVCPMTITSIKKNYGIVTNNPKKVIFSKPLPRKVSLSLVIENIDYSVLERTDFDGFNILLVAEV